MAKKKNTKLIRTPATVKNVKTHVGRFDAPLQTVVVPVGTSIGVAFERAQISTKGNDVVNTADGRTKSFTDAVVADETYLLTKNYSNGF